METAETLCEARNPLPARRAAERLRRRRSPPFTADHHCQSCLIGLLRDCVFVCVRGVLLSELDRSDIDNRSDFELDRPNLSRSGERLSNREPHLISTRSGPGERGIPIAVSAHKGGVYPLIMLIGMLKSCNHRDLLRLIVYWPSSTPWCVS